MQDLVQSTKHNTSKATGLKLIAEFTDSTEKGTNPRLILDSRQRADTSPNIFGIDSASSLNSQTDRMRVPHFPDE